MIDKNSNKGSQNYSYLTHLRDQTVANIAERREKLPFYKRLLVVDDSADITLLFKLGLEDCYYGDGDNNNSNSNNNNNKTRFEVYTYNDPVIALREFKPNFYDLLLTDINMAKMNGFELCEKVLESDINVRVCFMSAAEINIEALREVYPKLCVGCFIKKPVEMEYLVERLCAELD
jgi:CheY-like chemotaxis protein